jgi:hypothetical protein
MSSYPFASPLSAPRALSPFRLQHEAPIAARLVCIPDLRAAKVMLLHSAAVRARIDLTTTDSESRLTYGST